MRTPRLTRVSEGNPLRRLLVISKAVELFEMGLVLCHDRLRKKSPDRHGPDVAVISRYRLLLG